MFIGHFAVGFASKKFAPRAPLVLLLAAPLLSDLLWPFFLQFGWEHIRFVPGITRYNAFDLYDYPWSHSLLMGVVWATLFATIYFVFSRYRAGAITIWIGVISHWVLDWITHIPDMPLYPGGGPKLGLGLWNHVAATMIVEIAMFVVGFYLYWIATRTRDWVGTYACIAYAVVLLFLFVGARFSAQPESVKQIVVPGLITEAILLAWPAWFDHHRVPRTRDA
jgi:hypothetical protein